MQNRLVLTTLVILSLELLGCGGTKSTRTSDANGESLSQPDGSGDGSPDAMDGSPDSLDGPQDSIAYETCPNEAPENGMGCEENGLTCTYGISPRLDCRARAECFDNEWTVQGGEDCAQPPKDYCPITQPPAGGACKTIDASGAEAFGDSRLACLYDESVFCICKECPDGLCEDGPGWECLAPPAAPECPSIAPNLGDSCEITGLACDYGDPCIGGGSSRFCRNGFWGHGTFDCN